MNLVESFKQAMDSLKSNKLRSFLTMLGIIMGVFSVITIVAIGNAAQSYMDAQFEKLGANLIQVSTKGMGTPPENEALNLSDLDIIKKAVPEIKNINTSIQTVGKVEVFNNKKDAIITGQTPQAVSFSSIEMLSGRYLIDMDVKSKANVIVVDEDFAKKYYKRSDIVGEYLKVRINNGDTAKLMVVGVKKSSDSIFAGMFGDDMPVMMDMPVTTVQALLNRNNVDSIEVTVFDKDKLQNIGQRIVSVLDFKHNVKDKYRAQSSADIQGTLSNVLGVISTVLLVIAIITLIVGGIGIINILLVSVTERIREIGIRKALGAQKKDIIFQFLTESILMTGFSGLIGIVLGISAGAIISNFIKIPPVVNVQVIILSFLGSVLLGIIFGVYPAKRAADLDPIEALRYE